MTTCRLLEYLAEEEPIDILPKFSTRKKINIVSFCGDDRRNHNNRDKKDDDDNENEEDEGAIGPFQPMRPVRVPLWLAIMWKRKGKCSVLTPKWMKLEELKQTLQKEKSSPDFQPLPHRYREIAALVFHYAADDVEDFLLVRSLVEDVENARGIKARRGMDIVIGVKRVDIGEQQRVESVDARVESAVVTNMGSMEAHGFKRFLLDGQEALSRFAFFQAVSEGRVDVANVRQTRNGSYYNVNGDGALGGGEDDDEEDNDDDTYALPMREGHVGLRRVGPRR